MPRYLLFLFLTDIVMPSSHLPVAKTDSLHDVSVDNCLLQVLTWNPNWLHEYGMLCFMCLFSAWVIRLRYC